MDVHTTILYGRYVLTDHPGVKSGRTVLDRITGQVITLERGEKVADLKALQLRFAKEALDKRKAAEVA